MVDSPGRNPVILLHGLLDRATLFNSLCAFLEEEGWATHPLDLVPNNGTARLEDLAEQLKSYIDRTFAPGQVVDLIGYSMGGIVARFYLQRLAEASRVSRLITIGSPHRGTWTAHLLWSRGVRQMRPRSDFLRNLDTDTQALKRVSFTSIWTPLDLMIIPARSSVIPEARMVRVNVLAHQLLVRDRRVMHIVKQALLSDLDS